jgi:hypothetical protein
LFADEIADEIADEPADEERTMNSTGMLILLAFLAVPVLVVAYQICVWRYCERRIRLWADQNGYAVLRVGRWRASGGLLPLGKSWRVTVQDDEGGWRTGIVHFGYWLIDVPWGKMSVEWE